MLVKKVPLYTRIWEFLNKYYQYLIGLLFLFYALLTVVQEQVGIAYKVYLFILVLAAFTATSDLRRDVKWIPFLLAAVPIFLAIQYLSIHGYEMWGRMLSWQLEQKIVIDLNPLFQRIPLNDAAFTRVYQSGWLTEFMRQVYANGFVLPALVPIYRAIIAKDLRKILKYLLSAHIFQVFLITPFYLSFHLQETWYVLGHPDGMARGLSPEAAAGVTLNAFPSMHTSIAFAMFLVLLEEKNRLFKWVWGLFCLSVIYSTMYLEIHWVIDVLAGMLFAYATVKLVNLILVKAENWIPASLRNLYYHQEKPSLPSYQNSNKYTA